jgi:hypothetical protein
LVNISILVTTQNDENQSPNEEIQAIEQVKLIYETSGILNKSLFRILLKNSS